MTSKEFTYSCRSARIEVSQLSAAEYSVGDSARMSVTIDDALVRTYAEQYGDRNPIHLDEAAGRASIFGARIAHGMLSFNFFSTILGAGFPGPGTIFTGVQEWRFTAPVPGMLTWDRAQSYWRHWSGTAWAGGFLPASALHIGGAQVVGPRHPSIASPSGGTTIDSEARTAIAAVIATLMSHGLID